MKSKKKGGAEGFIVGTIITLVAFSDWQCIDALCFPKPAIKQNYYVPEQHYYIRILNAVTMSKEIFMELQAKLIPLLCRTIDKKVSGDRQQILEADSR